MTSLKHRPGIDSWWKHPLGFRVDGVALVPRPLCLVAQACNHLPANRSLEFRLELTVQNGFANVCDVLGVTTDSRI